MNEFKGTPGPWFVGEFGGVNGNGKFIGANPKPDGCTYVAEIQNDSYNTEQVACLNAKLIAAAPELLKELQRAAEVYDALLADGYIAYKDDAIRTDVAIAKALGTDQ